MRLPILLLASGFWALLSPPAPALAQDIFGDPTPTRADVARPKEKRESKAPPATRETPEERGDVARPHEGAPSTVVVVVSADPYSARIATHLQHIADARLARTAALAPIDVQATLIESPKPPGTDRIEAARALVSKGQTAYENLDFDGAIRALEEALQAYVEGITALDNLDEIAGAYARLGATQYFAGDPGAADRSFRSAALLSPTHAPDTSVFSPDLMEVFETQRTAALSAPTGVLTVNSRPDNVQVWIDGRYRGVTPSTLEDLQVGEHHVVGRRRGYRPTAESTALSPADLITLEIGLRTGPAAASYASAAQAAVKDAGPREVPASVRALASLFGAERLVLVGVRTEENAVTLSLTAYDISSGARNLEAETRIRPWTLKGRQAAVAFFDAQLPGVATVAAPPPAVTFWRQLPPYTKTWWFWTATGATLAAVGGGIALAASARKDPQGSNLLILGIP